MSYYNEALPGRDEFFQLSQRRIVRNLGQGIYHPDWRRRQVQQYIDSRKGTNRHSAYILEHLEEETDEYVKGLLNFREGFGHEQGKSYAWALQTRSHNVQNGLGSLVKALTLARCSPETIAAFVGTKTESIECFLALFWDVARYFDIPHLYIKLLYPPADSGISKLETSREGLLFTSAWNDGLPGLQLLLTTHIGLTSTEKDTVLSLINGWVSTAQRLFRNLNLRSGDIFDRSLAGLYAKKLQVLADSPPPSSGVTREKAFAEAMAAIGGGAPLDEFL